jgi:hypothetical protein
MNFPDWGTGIGKHLLKLNDGQSVLGIFRGMPERFYQHWKGGRSIICQGPEKCSLCRSKDPDDQKASGRFRINVLIQENGQWVAKVFENGRDVFNALKAINEDCPLERIRVRISRNGTGKNTQYSIMPLVKDAMVDEALNKVLMGVTLVDISLREENTGEPDEAA